MTEPKIFAKSGSTWHTDKSIRSYPIRNYDLIEFFKMCESKQEIIGIEIDIESHVVSLLFQHKEI